MKRLLCWVLGHDDVARFWFVWFQEMDRLHGSQYQECRRCGREVEVVKALNASHLAEYGEKKVTRCLMERKW